MKATDIIAKKRGTFVRGEDGTKKIAQSTALTREEIAFMVSGYVEGTIPDYQIASWLMAIYFNGMTFEETGMLTDVMLRSGDVIDLKAARLSGPFVDKHSTGGVGDKISLPLAPIAACCGVQVPMMSGRALGYTGGTLDKLESIEGYRTDLTPETFAKLIAKTGFAMTGQTKKIVPADRLLYALRDVTGTVESVSLITSSILSKKVAEGSDALVFDVKCGSGAFMKSMYDAESLALSLVKTAFAMGKKASAFITGMDTPLGKKVGNFLEIEETIECLEGRGPEDVMEETYTLCSEMLLLGGKAKTEADARSQCKHAVESGAAREKFLQNVEDQGGNPAKLLSEIGKRRSPHHASLEAQASGFLTLDALSVGLAGIDLGVGRNKTSDAVCPDAGFIVHAKTGDFVHKGDRILDIYGKDEACLTSAKRKIEDALAYSDTAPDKKALILKTIRQ